MPVKTVKDIVDALRTYMSANSVQPAELYKEGDKLVKEVFMLS